MSALQGAAPLERATHATLERLVVALLARLSCWPRRTRAGSAVVDELTADRSDAERAAINGGLAREVYTLG